MSDLYRISQDCEVLIYKDAEIKTARQPIVKEVPLTIVLDDKELATVLCSPHSWDLLTVGFLVSKGILVQREDLKEVTCQIEQGIAWVKTTEGTARPDRLRQRDFAGCCAEGQLAPRPLNDYQQGGPLAHVTRFKVKDLLRWAALLDEESKTFRLTGGVHEAALAYGEGFLASYEDIGRHNALDRIVGYTFLNEVDTADKAVILSSRISSEMLTKVARIGAPVVVSRAAPTSLALNLAEQLGITLIGFARGSSLNVYTHPGRIAE